jgi:hypothetical protein
MRRIQVLRFHFSIVKIENTILMAQEIDSAIHPSDTREQSRQGYTERATPFRHI